MASLEQANGELEKELGVHAFAGVDACAVSSDSG